MRIFQWLFGKKENSSKLDQETLLSANVCPNCWGKQEYQDRYIQYVKDQTKSNINHDSLHKKAFVQQFVENNITGIQLKKDGDRQQCPACNRKFKTVSSKAN